MERRARPKDSRLGIVQYPMAVDVFSSGGSRGSNSMVQIARKRGVFEVEIEIGPVKRERRLCNV